MRKSLIVGLVLVLITSLMLGSVPVSFAQKVVDEAVIKQQREIWESLTSEKYKRFPESVYRYDDLSKHYTITLASFGWYAEPMPPNDPCKKYIEERLNLTINGSWFTSGDDLRNKITTSFAAGEPIDLFYLGDRTLIRKLTEQGLILTDWRPYMRYIPTINQYMTKLDRDIRSINGKLFGVINSVSRGIPLWQTWIRKDWLDTLGLAPPKTMDQLLEVAKAFTFKDPDRNGKNDTWGFTSCGEGKTLGWIDGVLNTCFNIPALTIEDGKVIPRAINPRRKEALSWLKKVIDAKVIDPNWYVQDWMKAATIAGKVGSEFAQIGVQYMWVPSAPLTWIYTQDAEKNRIPGRKVSDWIVVPIKGYRSEFGIDQGTWCISAKAASDPGKLKRILHFLDWATCPNEGYWMIMRPNIVAGGRLVKTPNGIIQDRKALEAKDKEMLHNWSAGFAYDQLHYIWGILEWYASPPTTPEEVRETRAIVDSLWKIPTMKEYSYLVTGDPSIAADLEKFTNMNEYAFVTGRRSLDEWDKYVEEWLTKVGGQKQIDIFISQLKALGILK